MTAEGIQDVLYWTAPPGTSAEQLQDFSKFLYDFNRIPLTNPQALAALNAYRPLEQALLEDWGVWTEHID